MITKSNTQDIEQIINDFIPYKEFNSSVFNESDEFADLILHILKQIYTIEPHEEIEFLNTIEELFIQYIKTEAPIYSESHITCIGRQLDYLKTIPQPEQRTPEWYEFRNNRLTASDLYHITSGNENRIIEIVKKKCGIEKKFSLSPALSHGIKYEDVAVKIYEKRTDTNIDEFGCLPHLYIPFFGASPDGIVSQKSKNRNMIGRMLEIKCPKSRKITGIIPPGYYAQMQGQLEVCNLQYCDYLECEIREYDTQNDFLKDSCIDNPLLRSNGNEKGVIIEVYDIILKKHIYYYNYDLFSNCEELDNWENTIINDILETEHLEYIKTTFWKLNIFNVILVERNIPWFTKHYFKIDKFWNQVLESRKNNVFHKETNALIGKKYPKFTKHDEFDFIN
jgi:putative phage-type endonuclease